jgi:hypothetical protein
MRTEGNKYRTRILSFVQVWNRTQIIPVPFVDAGILQALFRAQTEWKPGARLKNAGISCSFFANFHEI